MRHRLIQDLYGRSFDSPASIWPHVDIGSRRCEADSWADGYCVGREWRRFLLAKETRSDVFVGVTRHRARHCVVASVLCLCGITSRRGLV